MNRDQYVDKIKAQIDHWNDEASKLEARARQARAGAKAQYAAQLQHYRERRDEAMNAMKRIQAASLDAWAQLTRGADAALKDMHEALDKARASFERKSS